jgi:hypothetical protein
MGLMPAGSPTADEPPSPSKSPETSVAYLRELEESLRYWYSAAETKAQVVLTLNGIFLAFLTGSMLTNRDKVTPTVAIFGPETWVFLAGMAAGLAGSILCAVACLMARGVWPRKVRKDLRDYRVDPDLADTYKPEVTVFFSHLAQLQPKHFVEQMRAIGPQFVVQALASDHIGWSKYILTKHRLVNGAFILTGIALGFFLCVGVSYLIRVGLAA